MTFVNYIGDEHPDILRAELLFVGEDYSHIAILGTNAIAVVPNDDIAPC